MTQRAQAVWKGVGISAIVSETPVSRSWSADLRKIGSLTAQTLPGASAGIDLKRSISRLRPPRPPAARPRR